jgi:MFS transporter, FHS family, Na+ dependent glucose transporter 1
MSTQKTKKKSILIQQTIGYYAGFIILGLTTAMTGPSLPSLAQNTGVQLDEISIIFIASSLGYILGAFLGGKLIDRLPGHRVAIALLICIGVLIALVPGITRLWLLVVVLFFLGIASASFDVSENTLLIWAHGSGVGPFMNGLHLFFGIGALIAPLIIAWSLSSFQNIDRAFWLFSLMILPVIFWVVRLPAPKMEIAADEAQAKLRNYSLLALTVVVMMLYVGAEVGFSSWLYTYVLEMRLSGEAIAAQLTSAFFLALTAGRLIAIPISTRVSPHRIIITDLVGSILSAGILLVWPQSMAALWIGVLGLGFSMASFFPTMFSYTGQYVDISGRITSWIFAGASFGAMVIPWIMGQLFVRLGPPSAILIVFITIGFTLVAFLVFQNRIIRQTGKSPSR